MKKVRLSLLALSLILTMGLYPLQAFAATTTSNDNQVSQNVIGYLTDNNTGKRIEVVGHLVTNSSPDSNTLANQDKHLTYAFKLYTDSSNSLSSEGTDDSLSVTTYLTINYETRNDPTEILLTGISGYWDILDPTVRVTHAKLQYASNGFVPVPVTSQLRELAVNNHFSYRTGFSKYVLAEGAHSSVGGHLSLDLKLGQNTWNFTFYNLYPD